MAGYGGAKAVPTKAPHTKTLCAGCAAVAALFAAPQPAAAQPAGPAEWAAAMARPAVVLVSVSWHGWVRDKQTGEVFGGTAGYDVTVPCSGAVLNPDGYVVTASHCVHTGPLGGGGALFDAAIAELGKAGRIGDPAKAKQTFVNQAVAEGVAQDRPVDRRIQVERTIEADGQPKRDVAPATVVDLLAPSDGDVAVLKIPREHLSALELGTDPPPVGSTVVSVGYPRTQGQDPDAELVAGSESGQVSALRTEQGRPFSEFGAATVSGMDGGPVVDTHGRVTGIISRTTGETRTPTSATAASTIAAVLRDKGITAKIADEDRAYRTGLEQYFAGDFDAAVRSFDAVLAASPTHRQAAEYRKAAIEKGGSAGSGSTLLIVFTIVSAIVAVAICAVGLFMVAAGRRRLVSEMDTPPFGIDLSPVGLSREPQPDGQGDTDKTDWRDRPTREYETEHQADPRDGNVEPGAPLAGHPSADKPGDGDQREEKPEPQRP